MTHKLWAGTVIPLLFACRPSMQEQDVTRLRDSLGVPKSAQCDGRSTWGGSMVREGLRIEIECSGYSPAWAPGPVPAEALAQSGVNAPELGGDDVTMHICTAFTLAQPNTNLFVAHPCSPWPENTLKVELGAVRAGKISGVHRSWF
jgi:hypothetical protein